MRIFKIAFQNLIYFSFHFTFVVKRFIVIPDRLNASCVWVCLCLWGSEEGCLFLSEQDLRMQPSALPRRPGSSMMLLLPSLQTKTLIVFLLHFFYQPPFLFHVLLLLSPWPQLLRGPLKMAFFLTCCPSTSLFYSYWLSCWYLKGAVCNSLLAHLNLGTFNFFSPHSPTSPMSFNPYIFKYIYLVKYMYL